MHGLAQRLKQLRYEKQLSVRELAHKAGVSASYIYAIESGARGRNLPKLEQIAKALDISIGELWDPNE